MARCLLRDAYDDGTREAEPYEERRIMFYLASYLYWSSLIQASNGRVFISPVEVELWRGLIDAQRVALTIDDELPRLETC